LRGAGGRARSMVLGGAAAIVVGACILAYATTAHNASSSDAHGAATLGIFAAVGAGMMWGTMYIPYRKAYLTGMSPLSFITFFTVGELGMMTALALTYSGGLRTVDMSIRPKL